MGEIADDIINSMIDRMVFIGGGRRRGTYQSGTGDYKWRTELGDVVSMYDMTDTHLRNAAAMCDRKGNPGKAKQLRRVLHDRYVQMRREKRANARTLLSLGKKRRTLSDVRKGQ